MNKDYTPVVFVVLAVAVAFFIGWQSKAKEKEASAYVVDKGLTTVKNEVKTQSNVTSQWVNQLVNTWKQIWGK